MPYLKCLQLLSIFFFLSILNAYTQFSAYHGIIFPYDNPNNVIHSAGSVTYALPDYSANILNNPVSSSFVQRPQIYLSFNRDNSRYEVSRHITFSPYEVENLKIQFSRYVYYPDSFSGVLPVKIDKRKSALAFSLNKINSPEYEVWLPSNKYVDLDLTHIRNGNVWNASIGISHQFSKDITVGLSWSKWFGKWDWHDDNRSGFIDGNGTFKYTGNLVNIGILKKFQNLSVCLIFHSPFTLLKTNSTAVLGWGRTEEYFKHFKIRQHFKGAYKLGIAYQWKNRFSISTGYRYQRKSLIILKRKIPFFGREYEIEEEYGDSHLVSLANEIVFRFKNMKIPVFLSYWVNWQPNFHAPDPVFTYLIDYKYFGYQFLTNDESSVIAKNLALGIKFPLHSIIFHLTSQWSSSEIDGANITMPRKYPLMKPVEIFEAKKSIFTINFGISYAF